jgi:hypothetical protein
MTTAIKFAALPAPIQRAILDYYDAVANYESGIQFNPQPDLRAEVVQAEAALVEAISTELRARDLALTVVANCVADSEGGVTLGSYEQGIVRAAIAKTQG